jgi:hypothetical protein
MLRSLINFKKTSLEKDYFLIKSLMYQLNIKIKLENEEIVKAIKRLESEVPNYTDIVKQLNNDITQLRIQLQIKNPIEYPMDEETEIITKIEEHDLTIKKLYRLISSKCHPDKTNNSELHELFILASEAYTHNNYLMILEIYNKLTKSDYSFTDITIDKKVELIKKEYETYKNEYDKMSRTNGYVIYRLINENKINQARKIFFNILFDQITELEKLKSQLEINLNKKYKQNE